MDYDHVFDWLGEPIKLKLFPDSKVTRIKIIVPDDFLVTPIMIYAKEVYAIPYKEYERSKLVKAARIDLGVDGKLIPEDERLKNFELFKTNNFASEWDDTLFMIHRGNQPKPGTTAYAVIKDYCLSPFGALMVKRVLNEDIKPKFIIGVSDSYGYQAGGGFDANFIKLPQTFPSQEYFGISKQKIIGVAIIHHEFEHTKYGRVVNTDYKRSILEEWRAVRFSENPVRILLGEEPRFIYYSDRSNLTINIITKETKTGKWMYDKADPSKPLVIIK